MDAIAEIKRLYYATSRATVQRDIEKAIDLLKTLKTEEDRERATVFMDGLSQMRSEWGVRPKAASGGATAGPARKSPRGVKPTAPAKKAR